MGKPPSINKQKTTTKTHTATDSKQNKTANNTNPDPPDKKAPATPVEKPAVSIT
jgi:hypothetical protein